MLHHDSFQVLVDAGDLLLSPARGILGPLALGNVNGHALDIRLAGLFVGHQNRGSQRVQQRAVFAPEEGFPAPDDSLRAQLPQEFLSKLWIEIKIRRTPPQQLLARVIPQHAHHGLVEIEDGSIQPG